MVRFGTAERNLSPRPYVGVEPEAGTGSHIFQVEPLRRSGDRLHPEARRGGFICPNHDCLAVTRPECTKEISVDGSSHVATVSLHSIHDVDILIIELHAVARIEIGDAFTVRRGDWIRRELRMRRDG